MAGEVVPTQLTPGSALDVGSGIILLPTVSGLQSRTDHQLTGALSHQCPLRVARGEVAYWSAASGPPGRPARALDMQAKASHSIPRWIVPLDQDVLGAQYLPRAWNTEITTS